jgi:hypothetical protein
LPRRCLALPCPAPCPLFCSLMTSIWAKVSLYIQTFPFSKKKQCHTCFCSDDSESVLLGVGSPTQPPRPEFEGGLIIKHMKTRGGTGPLGTTYRIRLLTPRHTAHRDHTHTPHKPFFFPSSPFPPLFPPHLRCQCEGHET